MLPSFEVLQHRLRDCLDSGILTKGKYLREYEENVATHLGVAEAVAVSSCTTGLVLAYRALGLTGEVILPSFTFMATAQALAWAGLEPVFVDIDPATWNIDPARIEEAITPRTSAIVGVHIFGNPAPCEDLEAIGSKHGLMVVFDAAHGFGALRGGRPVGGSGAAEIFSTSPTKLLVTGEGGIVATNDHDLAKLVRVAREYGNPGDYGSIIAGTNGRMPEWNAILGIESLKLLEANATARNDIARLYSERFTDSPGIELQRVAPQDRSSCKDFSILIDGQRFGASRDEVVEHLTRMGIQTRNYYDPPVHRHETYSHLRARYEERLPVTNDVAARIISLPIWAGLSPDDVCRVVEEVQQAGRR